MSFLLVTYLHYRWLLDMMAHPFQEFLILRDWAEWAPDVVDIEILELESALANIRGLESWFECQHCFVRQSLESESPGVDGERACVCCYLLLESDRMEMLTPGPLQRL